MTNSVNRNRAKSLRYTAGVFLFAVIVRSLFWFSLPGSSGIDTPYFKGDASLFLDHARALREEISFDRDLPLRAPGTSYLVAVIGGESPQNHTQRLRLAWIGLDSLAVALFFLAARRRLGTVTGWVVGLWCASFTPWLLHSGALNAEVPYLVLLGLLFLLDAGSGARPGPWRSSLWGALHGASCLFRPEHVLLALPWIGWRAWGRQWGEPSREGGELVRIVPVILAFVLALAPWHLKLWDRIREFHDSPSREDATTEAVWARIEEATRHVRWADGAAAARRRLPAAIRRPLGAFVSATADWRGLSRVDEELFREILREAFGVVPGELPSHPFVTLTGGLNFYLANHPESRGRFDRGPLDRPPPLTGGARRFPPALVQGLPPPDLSLSYPPHFEAVARGWRLGWEEIRGDPAAWLGLAAHKLALFWSGAAGGFTGFGLPAGMTGIRPPVDLLVPRSAPATGWRVLLLGLTSAGLAVSVRRREMMPWILFLASRLGTAVLFFGYARHGALLAPVIAILVVHAIRAGAEAVPLRLRARAHHLRIAATVVVALELLHWGADPEVRVEENTIPGSTPGSIPEQGLETRYLRNPF